MWDADTADALRHGRPSGIRQEHSCQTDRGGAPALRLTPDEWMIPLFGHHDADGKRDVLEGRFVWLALRTLRKATRLRLSRELFHARLAVSE